MPEKQPTGGNNHFVTVEIQKFAKPLPATDGTSRRLFLRRSTDQAPDHKVIYAMKFSQQATDRIFAAKDQVRADLLRAFFAGYSPKLRPYSPSEEVNVEGMKQLAMQFYKRGETARAREDEAKKTKVSANLAQGDGASDSILDV